MYLCICVCVFVFVYLCLCICTCVFVMVYLCLCILCVCVWLQRKHRAFGVLHLRHCIVSKLPFQSKVDGETWKCYPSIIKKISKALVILSNGPYWTLCIKTTYLTCISIYQICAPESSIDWEPKCMFSKTSYFTQFGYFLNFFASHWVLPGLKEAVGRLRKLAAGNGEPAQNAAAKTGSCCPAV